MFKARSILSFLVFGFLLLGAEVEWKKYTSEKGGFSVLFPGEPETQTQQVNMQVGESFQKINMYMFMKQAPDFTYLVVYNKMPSWNPDDADYILDKARDRGLASLNGKLLSEKDITLDFHPGREVKIRSPEGFYYRSRMYLVDDKFYQVSVTTVAEESSSANITKFLSSFKLLSEDEE
ncbi:hypothetical protein JXM67_01445 [candidate division WOR-3 bacterium]|nr:hypothetical protein [candidate division WOR-3 bacterium]